MHAAVDVYQLGTGCVVMGDAAECILDVIKRGKMSHWMSLSVADWPRSGQPNQLLIKVIPKYPIA
jgi:hypothetical protein